MALILHIETATPTCSVALGKNGKLLALKENNEGMKHASHLTVFIQQLLQENKLSASHLDAVSVSMGPGSYTGLRIGVSTAKGICYAGKVPLIAIGTLRAMVETLQNSDAFNEKVKDTTQVYYCPMIDARRMEVYTALYNEKLKPVQAVSAKIINENSFSKELSQHKIVFWGSGSSKCKEIISHPNALFLENIHASATGMLKMAEEKLNNNEVENTAYFDPFYLKDFVATNPKKLF